MHQVRLQLIKPILVNECLCKVDLKDICLKMYNVKTEWNFKNAKSTFFCFGSDFAPILMPIAQICRRIKTDLDKTKYGKAQMEMAYMDRFIWTHGIQEKKKKFCF